VNIDQLMESLSESAPDPDLVLASFGRKRRAARNRMYAASGGLAVAVVAVVAGVLLHGAGTSGGSTAGSAPASGAAMPAAAPTMGGLTPNGTAGSARAASGAMGCDAVQLQAEVAGAVRKGASVIVGYGTLNSGTAAVHGAGSNAPDYYSLTVRSVQTLAGPTVTSGSMVWVAGASPAAGGSDSSGSASTSARQSTFSPGRELFGIVSPAATSGAPGPVLQAAAVSDGQVLVSGAGCWDITVPGAQQGSPVTFGPAVPAAIGTDVITEVPLATAEKLAAQAG
jgi:hypothetical protein